MTDAPLTPGLRLMLWATPLLTVYIGLSYLLGSARRYSSPAYDPAKVLFQFTTEPMKAWGLVFLGVGVANLVLVATARRDPALLSICIGLGLYAFWAVVFAASLHNPLAPPPAPGYPLLVATLHLAMLMSLTGRTFHLPRWLSRAGRRRA